MRFRPCIDIHNGAVKQIVGSTLRDEGDTADTRFTAGDGAAYFARLFRRDGLRGGHVIMLNAKTSPLYEQTKAEALSALAAWPQGLQIGGGIGPDNAGFFLDAGASHVIVTSYVFREGLISWENLAAVEKAAGREHLVLDLSCKKRDGQYFIMTDRWQRFTDTPLDAALLEKLSGHCAEFLVHAIDVEGKDQGIDPDLVTLLAGMDGFPVTYAGGIGSLSDIRLLGLLGHGRVDLTVGSHLSLYGGELAYEDVVSACNAVSEDL